MPKRPREFFNPFSILVYRTDSIDVCEDRDYDGGEPYLTVVLREVPDNCVCRRPIQVQAFRASLDESDAIDMATAILRWKAIRDGRRADRQKMRARVIRERDRLRELDELQQRLGREADEI